MEQSNSKPKLGRVGMIALIIVVLVIIFRGVFSHHTAAPSSTQSVTDQYANLDSEVSTYLKDNFTGTSWYSHITGVQHQGSIVKIYTNIYPDAEGKQLGRTIAGTVLNGSSIDMGGVFVYGQNSYILDNENK